MEKKVTAKTTTELGITDVAYMLAVMDRTKGHFATLTRSGSFTVTKFLDQVELDAKTDPKCPKPVSKMARTIWNWMFNRYIIGEKADQSDLWNIRKVTFKEDGTITIEYTGRKVLTTMAAIEKSNG